MAESHRTLDLEHARRELPSLHDHIVRHWGRVEITRDEPRAGSCVLLSKAELECIERALEILHESSCGQSMAAELAQLAEQCTPPDSAKAMSQSIAAILESRDRISL